MINAEYSKKEIHNADRRHNSWTNLWRLSIVPIRKRRPTSHRKLTTLQSLYHSLLSKILNHHSSNNMLTANAKHNKLMFLIHFTAIIFNWQQVNTIQNLWWQYRLLLLLLLFYYNVSHKKHTKIEKRKILISFRDKFIQDNICQIL